MALLKIRQFGDPVLRERARSVDRIEDTHRKLVKDMIDTMRDAPGVGLAGNQVGVLERIFVWQVEENSGAFINPEITHRSKKTEVDEEGCLSIPGLTYPVERSYEIVVAAKDIDGQPLEIEASGYFARICQHEIDHLDGVLFLDRLPEKLRREAMSVLRDQALGLAAPRKAPPGETL